MRTGTLPVLATLALLGVAGTAFASTPALVVDVDSGRVLYAERATDPWFPASITKLMTTYVALEMMRDGRATPNTLLTMSASAASEPPSKMGFKPGTQVTLDNALKIIMVKSANDVAYMIGENLGGSIEGFAAMMNDAARRLGMRESRWSNPNGLPDDRQWTSARDMAVLARALLRDFPDHASLWRIGAIKLGPKIMRNHNGLLGRYPGADGMKTGFICAGGFNVVASATRNGRRIITVVMGYPTARERDLRVADLLDDGFGAFGWGAQTLDSLPPSGSLSPPNMRPIVCSPNRRLPQEDDETAMVQASGPASAAGAGNAEGAGLASLFAPSAFAAAGTGNNPTFGSRRMLGPRVAFEPIPVWLGPSPGGTSEEPPAKARAVAIAARGVKTKPLGRVAGALPPNARAFTATVPPSSVDEKVETIEPLRAAARPGARAALQANLAAKPIAETKPAENLAAPPRPERRKLGAIDPKPEPRPAALAASPTPPAPKPAAKLAKPQAKPKVAAAAAKPKAAKVPAAASEPGVASGAADR